MVTDERAGHHHQAAASSGSQRLLLFAHRKWRKRRRLKLDGHQHQRPWSNFKESSSSSSSSPPSSFIGVRGKAAWITQWPVYCCQPAKVCDITTRDAAYVYDASTNCSSDKIGHCEKAPKQVAARPEVDGNSITGLDAKENDDNDEDIARRLHCCASIARNRLALARDEMVKKFATSSSPQMKSGREAKQIDLLEDSSSAFALSKETSERVIEHGCDRQAVAIAKTESLSRLGMIIERTSSLREEPSEEREYNSQDLLSRLLPHPPIRQPDQTPPSLLLCHLSPSRSSSSSSSSFGKIEAAKGTLEPFAASPIAARERISLPNAAGREPLFRSLLVATLTALQPAAAATTESKETEKLIECFGSIIRVKRLCCCCGLKASNEIAEPPPPNDRPLACATNLRPPPKAKQPLPTTPATIAASELSPKLARPKAEAPPSRRKGPLELKLITPVGVSGCVSSAGELLAPQRRRIRRSKRQRGGDNNDTLERRSLNRSSLPRIATTVRVGRKLDDNDGDHHYRPHHHHHHPALASRRVTSIATLLPIYSAVALRLESCCCCSWLLLLLLLLLLLVAVVAQKQCNYYSQLLQLAGSSLIIHLIQPLFRNQLIGKRSSSSSSSKTLMALTSDISQSLATDGVPINQLGSSLIHPLVGRLTKWPLVGSPTRDICQPLGLSQWQPVCLVSHPPPLLSSFGHQFYASNKFQPLAICLLPTSATMGSVVVLVFVAIEYDNEVSLEWTTSSSRAGNQQLVARVSIQFSSSLLESARDTLTLTDINGRETDNNTSSCYARSKEANGKGFNFGRQPKIVFLGSWRLLLLVPREAANELTNGGGSSGDEFYDYICIDCHHDPTLLLLLLLIHLQCPPGQSFTIRLAEAASCSSGGILMLTSQKLANFIEAATLMEPIVRLRVLSKQHDKPLPMKLELVNLCSSSSQLNQILMASLNNSSNHLARYCHYTWLLPPPPLGRACHYWCYCYYYYFSYRPAHQTPWHSKLELKKPVVVSRLEWAPPLAEPTIQPSSSSSGSCCDPVRVVVGGEPQERSASPRPHSISSTIITTQSGGLNCKRSPKLELVTLMLLWILSLCGSHHLLPAGRWFPVVAAAAHENRASGPAPSIIEARRHRISPQWQQLQWPLHWEETWQSRVGTGSHHQAAGPSRLPGAASLEIQATDRLYEGRAGQNNWPSEAYERRRRQRRKGRKYSSSSRSINNITTSNHLPSTGHHHLRDPLNHAPQEEGSTTIEEEKETLEANDKRRQWSKLKAFNNDDYDNNDNSLSEPLKRGPYRADKNDNRKHEATPQDLSVVGAEEEASRRRQQQHRVASQATLGTSRAVASGFSQSSKLVVDDNKSNLMLVYGHNNIDEAGKPKAKRQRWQRAEAAAAKAKAESAGNKLIAGNRNDRSPRNGAQVEAKVPQATVELPRFLLGLNSTNDLDVCNDEDDDCEEDDKIARNGSIGSLVSQAGTTTTTTSLLRGGRRDKDGDEEEEVKNGSFLSVQQLRRRQKREEQEAGDSQWLLPQPQSASLSTRNNNNNNQNSEKRIERKLFRVGTRNDGSSSMEMDNKDIGPTDHYATTTTTNKEVANRESKTDGQPALVAPTSGKRPISHQQLAMKSLAAQSFKLQRHEMGPPSINATSAQFFDKQQSLLGAAEAGSGHTFGSITDGPPRPLRPPLSHSGHEQSVPGGSSLDVHATKWPSREGKKESSRRKRLELEQQEARQRSRRIIGRRHTGHLGHHRKLRHVQRAARPPPSQAFSRSSQSSSGHLMAAAAAAAAAAHHQASRGGGFNTETSGNSPQRLCPSQCTCLWKNGKHFADCSPGQHLQQQQHLLPSGKEAGQLPTGFDPLLQVLNYSANQLPELPDSAFVKLNLNNLQRIYLSNCHLESIHSRAFHNLKLIVELDFSWNKLHFVPLPQMKQLTLMRRLTMRGNPLYALNEATLSGGLISKSSSASQDTGKNDAATAGEDLEDSDGGLELPEDANSSTANEGDRKWWRRKARRLYETYPELAYSLSRLALSSRRQDQSLGAEDNFIIRATGFGGGGEAALRQQGGLGEQMLSEALDWWLQQDEQLASSASGLHLSGTNVDDEELDEELALDSNELASPMRRPKQPTFGDHFAHLQELDFGQCKLTYIKWTALERLDQLKRLLLDGNQLSQVSGKLVAALPMGLHQLSLEENPWKCDCRLFSLKRWLLTTRTPLSSPVRCHSTSALASIAGNLQKSLSTGQTASQPRADHQQQQHWRRSTKKSTVRLQKSPIELIEDELMAAETVSTKFNSWNQPGGRLVTRSNGSSSSVKIEYLDDLALDDFVCAPRALDPAAIKMSYVALRLPILGTQQQPPAKGGDGQMAQQESLFRLPTLESAFRYLEHTLIRPIERQQENETTQHILQIAAKPSSQLQDQPTAAATTTTTTTTLNHLTSSRQPPHRELVEAKEGERVTLNCSLLAHSESSLDIIWLVDYNHHSASTTASQPLTNGAQQIHRQTTLSTSSSSSSATETQTSEITTNQQQQQQQRLLLNAGRLGVADQNVGRLPAEERFIVLYDSKLHKYTTTNATSSSLHNPQHHEDQSTSRQQQQQQFVWHEVSLYGTRILIRETKSVGSSESIFKESQIIIQSAHQDDSARYKCIGLNRAGNSSTEYILHVTPQSATDSQRNSPQGATISALYHHSPTTRDQRAHTANNNNNNNNGGGTSYKDAISEAANKARILASQSSSQVTGPSSTFTSQPSGTWLKSSRTFQITIVVVSVLMASVIIAFLLFCIVIYQIKPSAASSSGIMSNGAIPVLMTTTTNEPNNVVLNNFIPLQSFGEFQHPKPQLV